MSNTRKNYLAVFIMTLMVAFFAFGCKKEVAVSSINFSLVDDKQIIMLVGEELNLNDFVDIKPANATNKEYVIQSFNSDIVDVNNGVLSAKAKGSAQVKITSSQNSLKQDLMTVVVWESAVTLASPANLKYDTIENKISFNAVPNAESYSLKIGEREIDLGNSTSLVLAEEYFDSALDIKVKANAPSYTRALETSNYSDSLKIYQVSAAKNVKVENLELEFTNTDGNLAKIYFDDLLVDTTSMRKMLLSSLNGAYAGSRLKIDVEMTIPDSKKLEILTQFGNDLQIYNSSKKSVVIDVLPLPELRMSSGVLEWQKDERVQEYKVLLDGVQYGKAITNNKIDVNAFVELDDNNEHVIEILPVVKDATKDLAATKKAAQIKVKKLIAPTISITSNQLTWNEIENSSAYAFKLTSAAGLFESSTNLTNLNMSNYKAGEYVFKMRSLAGENDQNEVCFLTSDEVEFKFKKHDEIQSEISNYALYLKNKGEDSVEVIVDENTSNAQNLSSRIEKVGEDWVVNLMSVQFVAGEHTITLKKLFNEDNKILESNKSSISFIQLEKINQFAINNGTATAVISSLNAENDAEIKLIISGAALQNELTIEGNVHTFNTLNDDGENYLPSGQYSISAFVYGNGSTTFGYIENGNVKECETLNFEVLSVPILSVTDSGKAEISISPISNAKFKVFEGEANSVLESGVCTYNFELAAEEKIFVAQAIGDGVHYLDSKLGQEISVNRLKTPELKYNRKTNELSFEDDNDETFVSGRVLKKDGEDFGFEQTLALENDTTFTLITKANVEVDGKYYLDSNVETLTLTKLLQPTSAIIKDNKLVLNAGQGESSLEIKFSFVGGESATLASKEGNVLADEMYELPYSYSNDVYTIDLIDASHKALMSGLLQGFDVEVTLFKQDNLHIDSNPKNFENLSLVSIDATTNISVEGKTLVLEPANHSAEYGLKLNIDGHEFVSNNANKLVSGLVELNYEYNAGEYVISLVDDKYNLIIGDLLASATTFNVKVMYTHSLNGEASDLDSAYSAEQKTTILTSSALTRNGQNIVFENVYPTFSAENYMLLIDETIKLNLNAENAIIADGTFVVDVERVFEKLNKDTHTDVHSVHVITTNSENKLNLLNKGEGIYVAKNPSVELTSFKDNDASDNSLLVKFNKMEQESISNRKYVVSLKTEQASKNKEFTDASATQIIRLDDEEFNLLTGVINVSAQVIAADAYIQDDKTIQVFNSNISNKLVITRVSNELNLTVENSKLCWDEIAGALGYEVFKIENGSYNLISKEIVKTNSFGLDMVSVEAVTELAIKAVGKSELFANSLYSASVKVTKLSTPIVSVLEGKIVASLSDQLALLLDENTVDLSTYVLNEGKQKDVSFEDFVIGSKTLTIEAHQLLNYIGVDEIVAESLTFAINVGDKNQDENGVFYLSSAETEVEFYGLFEPYNIRKTTDENNTVEQIVWQSSAKNKVQNVAVAEKYLFKMTYTNPKQETKEFYSNDSKLVFKNRAGEFEPYGTIAVGENDAQASITFPYGYAIGEAEEEVFGAGKYTFSLQAIPNSTNTGVNLASSKFTAEFTFEIMSAVSLNVEAGSVSWLKNDNATSYTVFITPEGEDETRSYSVENDASNATIKYNFENLPNIQGVCKVEVKAISTKDNVLNGEISKPIYIYRLPKAKSVQVDDGNLVFGASQYFTSAIIEFFDVATGKVTHSETYTNNSFEDAFKELGVDSWENISTEIEDDISGELSEKYYTVKLSSEGIVLLSNKDYRINIRLLGNTVENGNNTGFISSAKYETASNLTATKLGASLVEVDKGVVTFGATENVANLNYVLNKAEQGDFWKERAIIYKIDLIYGAEETSFYALDYYKFINELERDDCALVENVDYEIFADKQTGSTGDYGDLYAIVFYNYGEGTLVFDVYYENTIDVAQRDYLRYHDTRETNENGENTFETILNTSELNNGYNEIYISNYSTFTFSVTVIGGDSRLDENSADMTNPNSLGHISAFANKIKTINRYENNQISTKDGKILFNNLTKFSDDKPIDEPVYKFVVKQLNSDVTQVFYVYSTSKDNAQIIAKLNGDENVTFVEIETIEENTSAYLFDLTKYIVEGTYNVSIQTLSGKAIEDDGNYLINAKIPGEDVKRTIYKLYETELTTNNGLLKFDQSYTINDGVKDYSTCYEMTINDGTRDYVFKISPESQGFALDTSSRTITYDLPKEIETEKGQVLILDENVNYNIKIKALSGTLDGENGSMILNSTYVKNGEEDVVLVVRKTATAKNVRVENGMLKWNIEDVNSNHKTVVKISYENNGLTQTIFRYATLNNSYYESGIYQYHYLSIDDLELNYRENGYNINLTVASSTAGTLNSNPTEDLNINVLQTVDAATIIAKNGILTWGAISNATDSTKYRVLISGAQQAEMIVQGTELDLLNSEETKNLVAGNYSVQIQALSGENDGININSKISGLVDGFIKLNAVDLASVMIEEGVFKWAAVDNAEKYRIVFNYHDVTSAELEEDKIVDSKSYVPPAGVSGSFSLTIWAVGVENEKLFNSNSITYVSSTLAPKPVVNFVFDEDTKNRFIIETDDDFTNSDKIVIRYNLTKSLQDGNTENIGVQTVEIKYVAGQSIYYLPVTIIGVYENISAQVYRQNSVSSSLFYGSHILNMDLFEYGEGTEESPYAICNATQLMNIKYYAEEHAYFSLSKAIDMGELNVVQIVKENGGYLICETFNGNLSGDDLGKNYPIFGFNSEKQEDETYNETLSFENQYQFAMFKKLDGATISNIDFGEANRKLILTNMFAFDSLDMISLSWIATESVDSTIQDVDFAYESVNINLVLNMAEGNTSKLIAHSGISIAALFNTAKNTSMADCDMNVNVNVVHNADGIYVASGSRGKVYLAGAVAQAVDCSADNLNVKFSVTGSTNMTIHYIGGVFAQFIGNVVKTIGNSIVEVNMDHMLVEQFGGIVANATKLNIEKSSVRGTYAQTNIKYNLSVGGIVGTAADVNISECSVFVDFTMTISSVNTQQYIGLFAGNIYKNDLSSSIVNCASHLISQTNPINQTTIDGGQITYGIYGNPKSVVEIIDCKYETKPEE